MGGMSKVQVQGIPDADLVNVVCTFSLMIGLNSTKLVMYSRMSFPVKFNEARFAAFTVKFIAEGLTEITAHVFGTGAVVLTGACHADLARLAAWNLVWFLNKHMGIPAAVGNFTIRNIVSSFHLGFRVDLAKLKLAMGTRVRFNPDSFPAAIFNSALHANATALLYYSGNGVLTGLKNVEQVRVEYVNVYHVACMFERLAEGGFTRRDFRERQDQQLRLQASGSAVGYVDLDAPHSGRGGGSGKRDEAKEMAEKMELVSAAYRVITDKQAKALKRRALDALAALEDDSDAAFAAALPSRAETLAELTPDDATEVVFDELAPALLAAGVRQGGDAALRDEELPQVVMQMAVPPIDADVPLAPMRFDSVPVTAADSVCYVDKSGFIHLRTTGVLRKDAADVDSSSFSAALDAMEDTRTVSSVPYIPLSSFSAPLKKSKR
jgi:TATA-box binding protein (TBP) (component of TFIID and TFIIIB)